MTVQNILETNIQKNNKNAYEKAEIIRVGKEIQKKYNDNVEQLKTDIALNQLQDSILKWVEKVNQIEMKRRRNKAALETIKNNTLDIRNEMDKTKIAINTNTWLDTVISAFKIIGTINPAFLANLQNNSYFGRQNSGDRETLRNLCSKCESSTGFDNNVLQAILYFQAMVGNYKNKVYGVDGVVGKYTLKAINEVLAQISPDMIDPTYKKEETGNNQTEKPNETVVQEGRQWQPEIQQWQKEAPQWEEKNNKENLETGKENQEDVIFKTLDDKQNEEEYKNRFTHWYTMTPEQKETTKKTYEQVITASNEQEKEKIIWAINDKNMLNGINDILVAKILEENNAEKKATYQNLAQKIIEKINSLLQADPEQKMKEELDATFEDVWDYTQNTLFANINGRTKEDFAKTETNTSKTVSFQWEKIVEIWRAQHEERLQFFASFTKDGEAQTERSTNPFDKNNIITLINEKVQETKKKKEAI